MLENSHLQGPLVAGIDLGGTNIEIGILNPSGQILARRSTPTRNHTTPEDFVRAFKDILQDLLPNYPTQLKGIGLGAPNGNYYSGSIEYAPNLDWKGIVPLAEMVQTTVGVPAVLTNDANAAAIGEHYFGGAKGMRNFLSVTIGTGLGSGIFLDGRLIYGHSGFAGELGHTNVVPDGRLCTCGRYGCLEAYVSARGLVQTTQEIMKAHHNGTSLRGSTELDPVSIAEAARQGDPVALKAFDKTGFYLGRALADAVALVSPEAIFLFGGLMKAGDLLLEPTRRHLTDSLLNIFQGTVKLRASSLNEANAAVLGAGALAWSELKKSTSVS